MSEAQYKDYHKLSRHSLGLMSNEIWHRDPKMLGIHLARYKFVAKMLEGKREVAEIGCGDGFYSRVVGIVCPRLMLYDFDKDIRPYGAIPHDITIGPIWTRDYDKYDAIYSLDVLEHISPENEDAALTNVCNSLVPNGIFIVGMPSLESQAYASPASKIGHVNCHSGTGLKAVLDKYFHNVFLFSMHDEVITTAFSPMAHYLIGVCAGIK